MGTASESITVPLACPLSRKIVNSYLYMINALSLRRFISLCLVGSSTPYALYAAQKPPDKQLSSTGRASGSPAPETFTGSTLGGLKGYYNRKRKRKQAQKKKSLSPLAAQQLLPPSESSGGAADKEAEDLYIQASWHGFESFKTNMEKEKARREARAAEGYTDPIRIHMKNDRLCYSYTDAQHGLMTIAFEQSLPDDKKRKTSHYLYLAYQPSDISPGPLQSRPDAHARWERCLVEFYDDYVKTYYDALDLWEKLVITPLPAANQDYSEWKEKFEKQLMLDILCFRKKEKQPCFDDIIDQLKELAKTNFSDHPTGESDPFAIPPTADIKNKEECARLLEEAALRLHGDFSVLDKYMRVPAMKTQVVHLCSQAVCTLQGRKERLLGAMRETRFLL